MILKENLEQIQEKVRDACQRSGKRMDEVTLIAVCKGQSTEKIREAIETGQGALGENYVQEWMTHRSFVERAGLKTTVIWHFIGHLQRNKVEQIAGQVELIHSVDSISLAKEIDRRAAALNLIQPILLQVNVGQESSKGGLLPGRITGAVQEILDLPYLSLRGLMAIPPFSEDPEATRPYFRRLREIRDEIIQKYGYETCRHLSMGMTGDFEVAIEEGATMIRIGTGIFGERK